VRIGLAVVEIVAGQEAPGGVVGEHLSATGITHFGEATEGMLGGRVVVVLLEEGGAVGEATLPAERIPRGVQVVPSRIARWDGLRPGAVPDLALARFPQDDGGPVAPPVVAVAELPPLPVETAASSPSGPTS